MRDNTIPCYLLVDYSDVLSYVCQVFPTKRTARLVSQMNGVPVPVKIIIAFKLLPTVGTRKVFNTSMDRIHVDGKGCNTCPT